ncbi:hypothetical protein ACRAWD_11365 [Caulobacter segnis]
MIAILVPQDADEVCAQRLARLSAIFGPDALAATACAAGRRPVRSMNWSAWRPRRASRPW